MGTYIKLIVIHLVGGPVRCFLPLLTDLFDLVVDANLAWVVFLERLSFEEGFDETVEVRVDLR